RCFLSSADRADVSHAGGDQYDPGVFPRAWRSESYADQHHFEYVGTLLFGMADDPYPARRVRPAGVGEFLRMGGDAGASDSVDHYAMEERAADKLRKGVSNTLQKAKK